MSQPSPNFVQLPPNSSGLQVDFVQLPVAGQMVQRQTTENASPVSGQILVATANVAANTIGAAISTPLIPNGKTGYLARIKLVSTGFVTGGQVGGGYTLCPSGCSATIPASPFTILASTHMQGVNAFAYAFDVFGNEIFPPSFQVTRNSSGDLTITYTETPAKIVIMGPGASNLVTCEWTIMSGSTIIGYTVTGQGSDVFEPPHRFYASCAAGQAFSVVPTNPGSWPITVFATIWFDQF